MPGGNVTKRKKVINDDTEEKRLKMAAMYYFFEVQLIDNFAFVSGMQQSDSVTCSCLVAQFCWTLCNTLDYSPPSSSVQGISQARILDFLLQGIFPTPGIEPASPALQVDSSPSEPSGKPVCVCVCIPFQVLLHYRLAQAI